VRGGEWLNVVVILEGQPTGTLDNWDQSANARSLQSALAGTCAPLQDLVAGIEAWRLWALCGRPPMRSASEHAVGRVALLGDAAHPMFPYLAQGAGMAIEDAAELAGCMGDKSGSLAGVPAQLRHYAHRRWQRNARVQARAIRNGQIFHAAGAVAWARNMSMKLGGERLLDLPWLYGYGSP
jgi:salicylate hydroxylase